MLGQSVKRMAIKADDQSAQQQRSAPTRVSTTDLTNIGVSVGQL